MAGAKKIKQGRPRDAVCFGTFNELIVAPAEAANQISYAEGDGSSRVWALLYGCAKEILSPAGAFANGFHGIRRCLLHLPVGILYCIFRLFCLALGLGFYVAGSSSESLFHPAAEVFGVTDKAIFIHDPSPSEVHHFNRWNRSRFPFPRESNRHKRIVRCPEVIAQLCGRAVVWPFGERLQQNGWPGQQGYPHRLQLRV
jgi:hypothetical protein